MQHKPIFLLSALTFLSGACAFSYLTLLLRMLPIGLGDLYYIPLAIVSMFMLGLGMGAKVSWYCQKYFYTTQIALGVLAGLFPSIVFFLQSSSIGSMGPVFGFLLAGMLTLLFGLLNGFTLSSYASLFQNSNSGDGCFNKVGSLYFLGATPAVLFVEFYLIRAVGMSVSFYLIGLLNVACGVRLWSLFKKHPELIERERVLDTEIPWTDRASLMFGGLANGCFLIFFFQICCQVFGPFRENFIIGVIVILLGSFIGTVLVRKLKIRLSVFMSVFILSAPLIFIFYDKILYYYLTIAIDGEGVSLAIKLIFASVIGLLPAICFGAIVPSLMIDDSESVSIKSGVLLSNYFVATAFGCLAYGFYLYEQFPFVMHLGALIISGIIIMALAKELLLKITHAITIIISLILIAVLSFVWNDKHYYQLPLSKHSQELTKINVNRNGTDYAVLADYSNTQALYSNGTYAGTVLKNGKLSSREVLFGIIPAIYSAKHENALVIGSGAGTSLGITSRIFQNTDVFENNKALLEFLQGLAKENFQLTDNNSVNIQNGNARSFLKGKEKAYDAIVLGLESPAYFGSSKFFTEEFFDLALAALKKEGVFCLKIVPELMPPEAVQCIFYNLKSRFSACSLSLFDNDSSIIICSNAKIKPWRYNELNLSDEIKRSIRGAMYPLNPDQLIRDFLVSENIFDHYVPVSKVVNTDNKPGIEFLSASQGGSDNESFVFENQALLAVNVLGIGTEHSRKSFEHRAIAYKKIAPRYYESFIRPALVINEMQDYVSGVKENFKILFLRGGRHEMPFYTSAVHPKSRIEIMNNDPLSEETFKSISASVSIHGGDAMKKLTELSSGSYDLVVNEMIQNVNAPYEMLSEEFNLNVKRLISESGFYVLTLYDDINDAQLVRDSLYTLRQAFDNIYVVRTADLGYNKASFVIIGSARVIELKDIQSSLLSRGLISQINKFLTNEEINHLFKDKETRLLNRKSIPVLNADSTSKKGGESKLKSREAYDEGRSLLGDTFYAEAVKKFSEAIAFDPEFDDAFLNRGMAYAKQSKIEKAFKDYTKAITLNPEHYNAYNNRGNLFIKMKEFEKALMDYNAAMSIKKPTQEEAVFYFNRGNAHYNLQEYEHAIKDYERFIDYKPSNEIALKNRADAYYELGQFDKAIEDYARIIDINPDNLNAYINRSKANHRQGKLNEAIGDYDKIISLDPNNSEAYNMRGEAYMVSREYNKALRDYTTAIGLNPYYGQAYGNRAILYTLAKEDDKAGEDFNEAVKLGINESLLKEKIASIKAAINRK